MAKITFMGAGSTIFAKNIIGDSLLSEALQDSEIALYDIDAIRLKESQEMLEAINKKINNGRASIKSFLGTECRKDALCSADYVINAVQIGGYEPSTVIDFEIPKKYGLRQTIADTLGIGGIFRTLRTLPVMVDFAREMEEVCPDAWMLNYSNPMAMLSSGILQSSNINYVGLCHSVQDCPKELLRKTGLIEKYPLTGIQSKIAGINHQAWLLEIAHNGKDIYPEIKEAASNILDEIHKRGGGKKVQAEIEKDKGDKKEEDLLWHCSSDMIRLEMMLNFGYYITESSEHASEYLPYYIKSQYPELIDEYNIPLDEYPRRCIKQIEDWKQQSKKLLDESLINHERSIEYGSYIMEAMETGIPIQIGGNVMNDGLITNLPYNSVVEVPCLVDRNGIQPTIVGDLPEQLAALNRTNINPQILTVEAALTGKKDYIYQAAMLDPHTSAELPIDKIKAMCDDLIDAHGDMIPKLRN
jgi:alpha-galactosidase